MNDLEVFNAYLERSRLQVQTDVDWVNCVIKDIHMGTTGIDEINLMILSPDGYPSNAPNQVLSQKNFHRLRKKA